MKGEVETGEDDEADEAGEADEAEGVDFHKGGTSMKCDRNGKLN